MYKVARGIQIISEWENYFIKISNDSACKKIKNIYFLFENLVSEQMRLIQNCSFQK